MKTSSEPLLTVKEAHDAGLHVSLVVPLPVATAVWRYRSCLEESRTRGRKAALVVVSGTAARGMVEVWAEPAPPLQHVSVRDYSDLTDVQRGGVTGWAGNGKTKKKD